MPINASARTYRVWVCQPDETEDPGGGCLEVTNYCSGDSGGYLSLVAEPLGDNGISPTSGSLSLVVPPFDPAFDPWESPSRWAIGNHVLVQIADEAGTLRYTPINHLYIVAEPLPPYPGHWNLELELGDEATLKDSVKASALGTTSPQSRGAILGTLAAQADISFGGQMPEQNSLEGYEPDTEKPVIEAMGEIALGGYSLLYQSAGGSMTTTRINFKPERRLFKHTVGVDDAGEYEPIQNPIRPPSEVEVITTETAADPLGEDPYSDDEGGGERPEDQDKQKYSGSDLTEIKMSIGSIDNSDNTTEIKAIIRREQWAWQGARYRQSIEEQRCRGLVVPEDLFLDLIAKGRNISYPSELAMIDAYACSEVKIYESSDEGRLLTITTEATDRVGAVLAEWYKRYLLPTASLPPFFDAMVAERTETEFEYKRFDFGDDSGKDSQGQVRQIKFTRWLPKGLIAASASNWIQSGVGGAYIADDPTELVVAEVKIERWIRRSKDEWKYECQEYQAGRAKQGTIKAYLRLHKLESPTVISRNGDVRPPSAERRPAKPENQRRQPLQTLRAVKVGFQDTSLRPRQVLLQHLEGKQHAQNIAEILGKLDHYRHRGFKIVSAFKDPWFWWKPLSRIDLEYNGYVYTGLTDSISMTFSANQAIVVAACMRTGVYPVGDGYTYPEIDPLEPTDPDPEPFAEPPTNVINVEGLNPEPIIPLVRTVHYLVASQRTDSATRKLLHGVGALPGGSLVVEQRTSAVFFGRLLGELRTDGVFSSPSRLTGTLRTDCDFELAEAGLTGWWKLDTENWTDSIGGNDFQEIDFGAKLVYDSFRNVYAAEVNYDLDGTSYYYGSYLETLPADFGTRTPTHNWSWKLTFEVYWNLGDPDEAIGALIELRDGYGSPEFSILRLAEGAVYSCQIGSNGSIDGSVEIGDFDTNTWYEIEIRFDASTNELKAYIDGILQNTATISQPSETTEGDCVLTLGQNARPETRARQIKYYRTAYVERT